MVERAWHKDRLVHLGVAGGFETESVRSEEIWPCVYVVNTAAVENIVEVDCQPTWLEC
jgi:hypothetical protein